MSHEDELWEHKETEDIVDALMQRLMDGRLSEGYEEELLAPLESAVTIDFENHARTDIDPHFDERIDRIIQEAPEVFKAFKGFVEDAFEKGPHGDRNPQHFSIGTNQVRPPV